VDGGRRANGQPDVAINVLGELEVRLDGGPLPCGHARQRSVLTALAVDADRVVSVDGLIDRVWGERAPRRARSVLRTYLAHLRQALRPTGATIVRRDTGYVLAVDPETVDLRRFHRLVASARGTGDPRAALALVEDALELWRGEPLAESDTEWAHAVRERLRQGHLAARADRVDLALRCGRHRELVAELTTWTTTNPLDERSAGQLMLALYRDGRQADALAHYRRTRQRLVEELGADPGPELQRLHQRILTADRSLNDAPPAADDATGPAAAPRQLPAAPAPFVGRHDELDRLDETLRSLRSDPAATVVIGAIAGAGGIGKTWLALRWAHRNADRFPDGQLFVDLRGFSPGGQPMDPAVAVRGFLDALGVDPGRIPVDQHAQAALLRSLVAGKRMLLVLDNAVDAAQVTPLLPGSDTCTVLVTSRNRLPGLITGQGARHFALHSLDDTDARDLLTTRLGSARVEAEPAAVGELLRSCGGFPLALSIIAGRAHTNPHLPLTAIAEELRDSGLDALDEGDPAASLPAVLSWSRRALTTDQATAFALLGTAPGPDIGFPAAASLVGMPPKEARNVLRALEQASLISQDGHGRYRMHDLIRRHCTDTAQQKLPDETREAALRRVLDFYVHTAHTAHRLLDIHRGLLPLDPPARGTHLQPLPDSQAAMAWFDLEHTNLLAVHHTAVTRALHDAVCQLAWNLRTFHSRRGHRHDDLAVWRAAADAAAHLPDATTRIRVHRFLGRAYTALGRSEEATEHLHRALSLAEHHREPAEQAHTHRMIAHAVSRRGDDRGALDHAIRAQRLFREVGQPVWEASALNAVGWYMARLGDLDTARAYCQAALALHRQHRSAEGEASVLDSLGHIYHRAGDHHRAVDHYRQAVALFRVLGDTSDSADTLVHLGNPYAALGLHDEARAVWREALELYRAQGRDRNAEQVQRRLDALDTSPGMPTPAGPERRTHPS
jgi:DNA-binding SARP family transcriptional activator/tetratricopeptide (TPR) repeat protein